MSQIKIDIQTTSDGRVVGITTTHNPLPNIRVVLSILHQSKPKVVNNAFINRWKYDNIESVINNSRNLIEYQEWAQAIAEATSIREANKEGAVAAVAPGASGANYLITNNQVFKLQPVEVLATTNVTQKIKELVTDKAKAEAKQVISAAELSASALVEDANRSVRRAKEEVELLKRDLQFVIPKWVADSGLLCGYDANINRMFVTANIYLSIQYFDLTFFSKHLSKEMSYSWEASYVDPKEYTIKLVLNPDEQFNLSQTKMLYGSRYSSLPHLTQAQTCLELQGLPRYLRDRHDYDTIRKRIENACTRVQLNSMLIGLRESPAVVEALPEELKNCRSWQDFIDFAEKALIEREEAAIAQAAADAEEVIIEEESEVVWQA